MRRAVIALALAALVAALGAVPALAGGKTTKDSFDAQALPFPNYSSETGTAQRSCLAGQEGVHKVSHPFTAPAKGVLSAKVEGFTGDWDLFLTDSTGKELAGSVGDQIEGGDPATEEVSLPLKPKQVVNIVPCNFAGQPTVTVNFQFTTKK